MKNIIGLLLIFCFACILSSRPTSNSIGARGEKTYFQFNSLNGASINLLKKNYNESSVFKREANNLTDWSLDTISPTLIPEDRKLAYRYYSDIPGVVWIEKLFFCDETEVSNLDWIEYLQLSGDSTWHENINPTMKKINYNYNSQFYYFPVVNVSFEDAIKYCEWRTKLITDNYNKRKGYQATSPEYTVFEFSLPTKTEWTKCASFGTDTTKYPQIFTSKKAKTSINENAVPFLSRLGSNITTIDVKYFNNNIKSDYPFNCRRITNKYLNLETPFYIWDYPRNNFGIYNIIGNVLEMTSEKGIAKGGSFRNEYEECTVIKEFKYSGPSDHLGFRCVCKLKWPNK